MKAPRIARTLSKSLFRYPLGYFKYDFSAGVVVFLVAIPLCLGVALASGAPLFAGLISGIIGGIVVGFLSGSHASVSGPAAGMVAVVLAAITQLGSFNDFLLALLLAGMLQIAIGLFRVGFIADYIPSNVIQGLLCAIGILIIIKQLPFAFTYTADGKSLLNELKTTSETLHLHPFNTIQGHLHYGAMIVSFLSIATLLFFDKTKNSYIKAIPGPVVVVILGVVINETINYFWSNASQLTNDLVEIPVNDTFATFLSQFQHPNWQSWINPKIYLYAFILAAVASLEALLNLEAIESLDRVRRFVSRDRELVAQGFGNMFAGLLGGIPVTSVIVRSSVNIQAGARSKLSTIIHGFLILLVIIFIPNWMNRIPLASLAAILIYVGFKLTSPKIYKEMYKQGMSRFLPFIVTILAIVSTDLLTGVLIGLSISFFFILRDNSRIQLDIINEKHPHGIIKRLILPQQLSFLSKASLVKELSEIPEDTNLIIDARYTKYMDKDIINVIDVFQKKQAPYKRIALNLIGFKNIYALHDRIDFINVTTYNTQASLTPSKVLEILKEGNKRFVKDKRINRSVLDDIKATSTTQHPLAIILSCIDSRVPVETIFDMGLGDLFVVRIAGNVINDDILGSMEFACHIAGAKLIVVLGHTSCGAIKAACDDGAGGHVGELLNKIKIAVNAESQTLTNRNSHNDAFVANVTKINIDNSLKLVKTRSTVLNRLLHEEAVGIVGAIYDVHTGKVHYNA